MAVSCVFSPGLSLLPGADEGKEELRQFSEKVTGLQARVLGYQHIQSHTRVL